MECRVSEAGLLSSLLMLLLVAVMVAGMGMVLVVSVILVFARLVIVLAFRRILQQNIYPKAPI